jgi:hypothetical protein
LNPASAHISSATVRAHPATVVETIIMNVFEFPPEIRTRVRLQCGAEYSVSKGSQPGTTINEENEKLLLSALLRFIAL